MHPCFRKATRIDLPLLLGKLESQCTTNPTITSRDKDSRSRGWLRVAGIANATIEEVDDEKGHKEKRLNGARRRLMAQKMYL